MPDSQVATGARDGRPQEGVVVAVPAPPARDTLTHAAPGLVLIVAVCLTPLWGVLRLDWGVLAVVFVVAHPTRRRRRRRWSARLAARPFCPR